MKDFLNKFKDFSSLAQGIYVLSGYSEEKQEEVTFKLCEDSKNISIDNVILKHQGRFLKVTVNLHVLCPGKKIALGVILKEEVGNDLIIKGLKVCEISMPKISNKCIEKVFIKDFCFIIPEDDICDTRKFKIDVISHYSSFNMHT